MRNAVKKVDNIEESIEYIDTLHGESKELSKESLVNGIIMLKIC